MKKKKSGSAAKSDAFSRVKTTILSIAIILILTFFIQLRTFFDEPQYDDFCDYNARSFVKIDADCKFNQSLWDEAKQSCDGDLDSRYGVDGCVESYDCNTCRSEYEKEDERYSGIVFWVSLILGLLILIAALKLEVPAVSSGLMGGAVLTIFIGVIQNWRFLTDIARFVILGLVLIILIWLAYKKLNK